MKTFRIWSLALVALIFAAATFGVSVATASQPLPAQIQTNPTDVPNTYDLKALPSPKVMAWNANTRLISWYSQGQPAASFYRAANERAAMSACGALPSGDMLLVVGGENPQLTLAPKESGALKPIAPALGIICTLPNRLQYSPDGSRMAILQYTREFGNQFFAVGSLRVFKLPELTEQVKIDNVAGFELSNDGALAVQLFPNAKNQAKSADVVFWDGTAQRKIDTNVKPLDTDEKQDCELSTASVARLGDTVYLMTGESCIRGRNNWRLRSNAFAGGNAKEISNGPSGANGQARFSFGTNTNDLFALPNGKGVLFLVPNGLALDVGNMGWIGTDGKLNQVLSNVATNQYPVGRASDFVRSPDGNKLAFTTRDGNQAERLYVYDLTTPEKAPVAITTGAKVDRILGAAWTADSSKVFYNLAGDAQALFVTDGKAEGTLIARGFFNSLAISPDGAFAAVNERITVQANDFRNNLVVIKVADGSKTNLVEGKKGDIPLQPLFVR